MALLKLKATKPFRYASRALAVGDEFEATSRDARVLHAIRKAEYVRSPASVPAPNSAVAKKIAARAKPASPAKAAVKPVGAVTTADIPPVGPTPTLPDTDAAAREEANAKELRTARAEYEASMGKRPFPGWDVATIRQKMADKEDAEGDDK
jgi:hypothetical protein